MSILVSEIFGPTVQGEGALIGRPTIFVRTASCDYRCLWCDTMYAVSTDYRDEWSSQTAESVFAEVERLSGGSPMLITLSGGNPAIQPLEDFIELAHGQAYSVAMETQGSINQSWLSDLDYLTLSPKPPSAKVHFDREKLLEIVNDIEKSGSLTQVSLKFVVADDTDLLWAYQLATQEYPFLPVSIQPCLSAFQQTLEGEELQKVLRSSYESLIQKVFKMSWPDVKVLPQLHTMIWGNQRKV